MSPIARALSADNIDDVAAYYANSAAQFPPLANADPQLVKRGKELAETAIVRKVFPAAESAMAPGRRGVPDSPIPRRTI